MSVMMKLLILTESPFQYGYHDMIRVVVAGHIFFFKDIYYKVDIEYVCMFAWNIVHFAKLITLPDREYDKEHDVSIYFARANNELIVCFSWTFFFFLLESAITQRAGKEL